MAADNRRFLIAAAGRRSQATRERTLQGIRELAADGAPISFEAVAKRAGVSRSWLYAQPDLRAEIGRLRALVGQSTVLAPAPARPAHLRRLATTPPEAATTELRRLREENQQLRQQLAHALGGHRAAAVRPSSPTQQR